MKLLVDATAVRDSSGGMATYLRGLLGGWAALDHGDEVHLLGMRDLPEVEAMVTGRVERSGGAGQLARLKAQQVRLPQLTRALRPDVILTTDPSIPLWPRLPPVVATVHDLRHLRQPAEFSRARRIYRGIAWAYGLRRADALVANSQYTADHVVEVAPGARRRLHVVHFGCDHVDGWGGGSAHTETTEQHAIAFAHWTNKRPDLAIRAWGRLRARCPGLTHTLDVVGARGEEPARLRALAHEAGVADLVRVHGFLDDDAYRALFATAALVVMPSTLEGFGFPVLEAMRLGIPAVVSRGAGMEEAGGDWAFYVEGADPEAFAAACERALFDEAARRSAVAGGRAHASRFTWAETARRMRGVLASVARAD